LVFLRRLNAEFLDDAFDVEAFIVEGFGVGFDLIEDVLGVDSLGPVFPIDFLDDAVFTGTVALVGALL
jgi:hypothetical protein